VKANVRSKDGNIREDTLTAGPQKLQRQLQKRRKWQKGEHFRRGSDGGAEIDTEKVA
jgi:hypothetical protein